MSIADTLQTKTKTAPKNGTALSFVFGWGSRIRTYGIPESESGALPLGDTPIYRRRNLNQRRLVGIDGFEPSE